MGMVKNMVKAARTCDNGNVSQHFGQREEFVVYEIEKSEIKGREIVKNPGHIPRFLPKILKEKNVDLMIRRNWNESSRIVERRGN